MYCIGYVIKNDDSLYSISRNFNVSQQSIMELNPTADVYNLMNGETIYIPVSISTKQYAHYTTYLVKDEDTLGKVLDDNSLNIAELMQLNDPDEIFLQPGTTLKVPIKENNEDGVTL